jgi:hypothetical protein
MQHVYNGRKNTCFARRKWEGNIKLDLKDVGLEVVA